MSRFRSVGDSVVIEVMNSDVSGVAELGKESAANPRLYGPHVPGHSHVSVRSGESAEIVRLSELRGAAGPKSVQFLGLAFDPLSIEAAAKLVLERGKKRTAFAWVATPNADHRVRIERDDSMAAVYESAWLTLLDSRVIEMMARVEGISLRATPGADLVEHLIRFAMDPAQPINVIGCCKDVIETLRTRFGLTDLRWHAPPMGMLEKPEAIAAAAEFVAKNPADVTFICVGSPQQEMLAKAIADRGDATGVGLCCGASLEFLTGKVQRAPLWMRNLALEWLFRFVTNPRRFARRYFWDDPAILPIWWSDWRARTAARKQSEEARNDSVGASRIA